MATKKAGTAKPPWDRKRPAGAKKTALTPASKAKAKSAARKAGRPYPNLVDNMHAGSEQRSRKKSASGAKRKTAAAKRRTTGPRKTAAKGKTAGTKKTAAKRR